MSSFLLSYTETNQLLQEFNIPIAPGGIVQSIDEGISLAAKVGFPVALKCISPQITHKTDSQLVALSLQNLEELAKAAEKMLQKTQGVQVEGLLVQKMLNDGVEVLVGSVLNEQFGQMLVIGYGGILTELVDSNKLGVLPLNGWQIQRLIEKMPLNKLIMGYRGAEAKDRVALIQLIRQVSELVSAYEKTLISLDLNPVIVLPEGAFVVDARVFMRKESDAKSK